MKPAVRRPLMVTAALAVAALVATTVTGAASAAAPQKETAATAVLPAATVVPAGRVRSLVAASAPTSGTAAASATAAASESVRSAGRALAANRPPCASTVRACVSLGARKAWLMDGAGSVVYGPVGVLGGRKGEPTPVGTFSVSKKVRNYHSREFDAPMPFSVFFSPGIAFHTGSLSTRSAGCLHLGSTSAKRFFSELASGDRVQVVS